MLPSYYKILKRKLVWIVYLNSDTNNAPGERFRTLQKAFDYARIYENAEIWLDIQYTGINTLFGTPFSNFIADPKFVIRKGKLRHYL